MEFVELLKAYKDLGYLGLFLFMLWVCYREIKASKAEAVAAAVNSKNEILAITERVVKSLDAASTAMSTNSQEMQGVIESTEAMNKATGELIAI